MVSLTKLATKLAVVHLIAEITRVKTSAKITVGCSDSEIASHSIGADFPNRRKIVVSEQRHVNVGKHLTVNVGKFTVSTSGRCGLLIDVINNHLWGLPLRKEQGTGVSKDRHQRRDGSGNGKGLHLERRFRLTFGMF